MLYAFERVMPYVPDFPANEVGSHKECMPCREHAFSEYMPYIRVDCIHQACYGY